MPQGFENFHDLHIKPLSKPAKKDAALEYAPAESKPEQMEKRIAAQEIARGGDFENILVELEDKKLLDEQTTRFHETYDADLKLATFLTPDDWKALTVLELYDTGTFLHSLETYRIAKKMMEKTFIFGNTKIELATMIRQENRVSLEQFYRACLLHDIGKVEVPHFIITSEISHAGWAEMLVNMDKRDPDKKLLENILAQANMAIPTEISVRPDGNEKDALLVEFLKENKIRCEKYVPIEEAVDNRLLGDRAFTERNITDLESRDLAGLTRKSPLFDISRFMSTNQQILFSG